MEIPTTINLSVPMIDFPQLFAVYLASDETAVRYVGVSLVPDLFKLEDAQCNSEWSKFFARPDAKINLSVASLFTSEIEARQEQRKLIGLWKPECNMRGYFMARKYQQVMCNETGEIFNNAAEAARAHGIDPTALGRHLKQEKGFKSVKGRTYQYTIKRW